MQCTSPAALASAFNTSVASRFTGLSKADWNDAMKNAETEYKAKYSETDTNTEAPADSKIAV